jgi:hypothetical protein
MVEDFLCGRINDWIRWEVLDFFEVFAMALVMITPTFGFYELKIEPD